MANQRYRITDGQIMRNGKLFPAGAVLDDLTEKEVEQLSGILEPVGPDAVHEKHPDDHRDFDFNPDGSMRAN